MSRRPTRPTRARVRNCRRARRLRPVRRSRRPISVWQHHTDEVPAPPPGFRVLARSDDVPGRGVRRRRTAVVGHAVPPGAWSDDHPAGRTFIENFFRLAGIPLRLTPTEILFVGHDDRRLVSRSPTPRSCLPSRRRSGRKVGARSTLDPRVQHVPDPAFPGHFNVLRATVWPDGFDRREGRRRLCAQLRARASVRARARHALRTADRAFRSRSSTAPRSPSARTGGLTAAAARHLARPGSEGARPRRRARHGVLQRDDARPSLRLRRDSRDEQTRRESRQDSAAALEEALGKRLSGQPTPSARPSKARTSSSRQPG